MCDPVTILAGVGGLLAAKALSPSVPSVPAAPTAPSAVLAATQQDPAAERAKVETDAADAANQKLVDDKRSRRANVLALGGSSDALGQMQSNKQSSVSGTPKTSVLGGGAT